MNIRCWYRNGNYTVILMSDGTKIRKYRRGSTLRPEYPESIDIKLTDYCPYGCKYCHEKSNVNAVFNSETFKCNIIDSLRPGMELALGGGALSSIDRKVFKDFLLSLNENEIIANATVNQYELRDPEFLSFIRSCLDIGLIKGLGISLIEPDEDLAELAYMYRDNIVFHIINGIATKEILNWLAENRLKVLILGYKVKGRGVEYIEEYSKDIKNNQEYLKNNIKELKEKFITTSFDCLAVDQLGLKDLVSEEEFKMRYMGSDGEFTMYIDLPRMEFSISSTSEKRWPIGDLNITKAFKIVRDEIKKKK